MRRTTGVPYSELTSIIELSLALLRLSITTPLITSGSFDDTNGRRSTWIESPAKICGHFRPFFSVAYSSETSCVRREDARLKGVLCFDRRENFLAFPKEEDEEEIDSDEVVIEKDEEEDEEEDEGG